MKKKLIFIIMFALIIISRTNIFAGECPNPEYNNEMSCGRCGYSYSWKDGKCTDEQDTRGGTSYSWWTDAYNFFNGSTAGSSIISVDALSNLENILLVVGNMIFFVVTVVLGVKYIWGSVDSKASVKESLITLIIAAIFFYGYSTIKTLFVGSSLVKSDFNSSAKVIYNIVMYICNYLAIGGIIYVGIRYMMTGAAGKAELKTKSVPIILGIIMVYATLTFLTFIVNAFA